MAIYRQEAKSLGPGVFCFRYGSQRFDPDIERMRHRRNFRVV